MRTQVGIHTDFGYFWVPFTGGMTVSDLVQKTMDQTRLEIRGGYSVQERNTGHQLQPSDAVYVDRTYHLNAFTTPRRHRGH